MWPLAEWDVGWGTTDPISYISAAASGFLDAIDSGGGEGGVMTRALPASVASLVLAAGVAAAHPHFNKTVTAKLPSGVDATVTYNTTPANEIRAHEAAVGAFVTPRRPMLKLSGEVKAGAVTIPAGDYTIGVIKNSEKDWTMALYPGATPQGAAVDVAKTIKLESEF